jgi:hypothetical protein
MESIAAGNAADRAEAKRQAQETAKEKMSDAANTERANKLTTADVVRNRAQSEEIRTQGHVSPAKQAEIDKEWLRQSQQAYDNWSLGIRNRGGSAADFTVNPDGSVVQSTESYGRGGKPVPLGAAAPAAPTSAQPVQPTGGGGRLPPAVNTGGGRGGGRGAPPAQPPTQAASPSAAPQQKSEPFSVRMPNGNTGHFANRAAAEKFFSDRGLILGPDK